MLMGDPSRRTEPWDSSAFSNRRDGRVVEGARLESVYRGNSIEGSNPSLSASYQSYLHVRLRVCPLLNLQSSRGPFLQTAFGTTFATPVLARAHPPARRAA